MKWQKIEPFVFRYRIVKPSTLLFSSVKRVRSSICALVSYRWAETINNGPEHTV